MSKIKQYLPMVVVAFIVIVIVGRVAKLRAIAKI